MLIKIKKYHLLRLINLCAVAFTVSACSSNSPKQLLPSDGPTTQEVYQDHITGGGLSSSGEQKFEALNPAMQAVRDIDPSDWTRLIDSEMSLKFPRIPNTEIHGYVFPHLSSRGHPIPGYSTSFPLYETLHYALPGEVVPTSKQRQEINHDQ
ncbi:MAG: TIGR03751 family conjugal transfer lipoprotein [Gammaproteobacteria bacterium]|nr:TIGR03751 family conjugal transfer lipoprotein [Gammaproteobacteria bacterium]